MIGVTLDSNIYVSALQFGGIGVRLVGMARAGAIRMDTSEAILAETMGVLRDKFGWDGYRLHFARLELRKFACVVEPRKRSRSPTIRTTTASLSVLSRLARTAL